GGVGGLGNLGEEGKVRGLVATLDKINKGSEQFGDPKRIVTAWNIKKDDLGFTNPRNPKPYKTILHYVFELNRLAQASMGKDYVEAAKAMPKIRLSGVRIHAGGVGVHPRAVYFAAAGPIGTGEAAANGVQGEDAADAPTR